MPLVPGERPTHGHHKLAASIFVASLILGASMILSAELMKPERYEFYPGAGATNYILYDRDTGRAASVDVGTTKPLDALK